MTTKLTRPIRREVQTRTYGLCVLRLEPEGVYVRQKGRRRWYGPLAYGFLYQHGAMLAANAERSRKAAARAAKRGAR